MIRSKRVRRSSKLSKWLRPFVGVGRHGDDGARSSSATVPAPAQRQWDDSGAGRSEHAARRARHQRQADDRRPTTRGRDRVWTGPDVRNTSDHRRRRIHRQTRCLHQRLRYRIRTGMLIYANLWSFGRIASTQYSLEKRRIVRDLVLAYKIVFRLVDVQTLKFFRLRDDIASTRGKP